MDTKPSNRPFIHPEGWKFALIFFVVSVLVFFVYTPISIIGFLLTLFTLWFFRDPSRNTPVDSSLIISSADGKVCLIDEAYPPKEVSMKQEKMKRVCVFMNVFNVHVNRSPVEGKVKKIAYTKGSFLNASLDKASEKNERNALVIQTKENIEIVVVQIAGLIARRILSFIKDGHRLKAGERFGLIRFGSRVDVYLPINTKIDCGLNQKVVAGESILASLS